MTSWVLRVATGKYRRSLHNTTAFLITYLCSVTQSYVPPVTLLPSYLLSYFRPLMLPLTCTASMVCHPPETQVQLSMVTRSVCRLLHGWVLFPNTCVCGVFVEGEQEERGTAFQVSHPLLQLCGSLGHISHQLYRRVGSQIVTFCFNHVDHVIINSNQ